jgi:hypothetical protein
MLFPTLRTEDSPVLMHVQRSRDVTVTAVDLVRTRTLPMPLDDSTTGHVIREKRIERIDGRWFA